MGIEGSKTLLKSKTALGAIIAVAPAIDAVLANIGVTSVPVVEPFFGDFMTIFGAILAIVGRVQATAKITKVF